MLLTIKVDNNLCLEVSGAHTDENDVHSNLSDAYELKDLQSSPVDSEPESSNVKTTGLSIVTAGVFIIGEICGAGAISFPQALSKTGLSGKRSLQNYVYIKLFDVTEIFYAYNNNGTTT